MKEFHDEGIVLQRSAFSDKDQILTVFTKEHGVVKMFCKARTLQDLQINPLCHGDFLFRSSKGSLHKLIEFRILDYNLRLRENFQRLQSACTMTKKINESQLIGKASPALFVIFQSFLKRLSHSENCETLLLSFFMKLMRHEGILAPLDQCVACNTNLGKLFLSIEGAFCEYHSPAHAICFTEKEKQSLQTIAFSKSLQEIEKIKVEITTKRKIEKFAKGGT